MTTPAPCREAFEKWYRQTYGINWTGQEPNMWISWEASWNTRPAPVFTPATPEQMEKIKGLLDKTAPWEAKDYVETSKLKEAFGMFLNGMAYYETFPDNEEDAAQLRKAATYNFLRARNHISDELSELCNQCCKAVYKMEEEKAIGLKITERKDV